MQYFADLVIVVSFTEWFSVGIKTYPDMKTRWPSLITKVLEGDTSDWVDEQQDIPSAIKPQLPSTRSLVYVIR